MDNVGSCDVLQRNSQDAPTDNTNSETVLINGRRKPARTEYERHNHNGERKQPPREHRGEGSESHSSNDRDHQRGAVEPGWARTP